MNTTTDPEPQFATVELNGKTYSLTYNNDLCLAAERATRCRPAALFQALADDFKLCYAVDRIEGANVLDPVLCLPIKIKGREFQASLLALLGTAHPEITLDDARELMTPENLPKIVSGIRSLLARSVA
jgi:hypothetical protein